MTLRKPDYKTGKSDNEWYTPRHIIDALGPFDLDPCAPAVRIFDTAKKHLTKADDGLATPWDPAAFVWMNPPFQFGGTWLEKLADHGNGIALLPARVDTRMFFSWAWGGLPAFSS